MNVPSLDKTKSLLIIGGVAVGAYLLWKASQAARAAGEVILRNANQLGQTVSNVADNASQAAGTAYRYGALTPWNPPPGLVDATTSQMANWWNDYFGTLDLDRMPYDPYSATPDTFTEAAEKMTKPSMGRLSQPSSRYRNA